ncbi:MAG: nitroreductase family protein [Anaerolineales bacterium]
MPKIDIDQNRCNQDGLCVMVCPMNVLVQEEQRAIPNVAREELCISCGHCLAVCPQEAIAHDGVSQERIRPVLQERLPAPEMLTHLINVRRSVRALKNTPVEKELVEQVIHAARFAPSGHNVQSTEYVVVQDQAMLEQVVRLTAKYLKTASGFLGNPLLQPALSWLFRDRYENIDLVAEEFKLLAEMAEVGEDKILHQAPTLIVFHARQSVAFAAANANMAAQNASLMAQSLGLGAFYTGYVLAACEMDNSIPKLLGIPQNHRIYAGLALGHPAVRYTHWIERDAPKVRWM